MLPLLLSLLACGDPRPPPAPDTRVDADVHPGLAAHAKLFEREVLRPADGVYVAVGFALANVIAIEGADGLVIVDTTEGREAATDALAALREHTDLPVAGVVLTHNHADHVFGGRVFTEGRDVPVLAHADTEAGIDRIVNVLRDAIQVRSTRMFGSLLDDPPAGGIGLHLRFDPSQIALARPTETFTDRLERTIAGVHLELVHAPGETDDQLFVWLPERRVLLPADNVYQSFPNLYTIRGTPYRDVRRWVDSIDAMRDLQAEVLVPSHTRPVVGADAVEDVLVAYRDAIQFVHDQTIRGLNQGRTPDDIAATLQLPPHLAEHPWLQEHYGHVPYAVRSIAAGNLGWFDGRGSTLEPLPPRQRAQRFAEAFASQQTLPEAAEAALAADDWRWAAELAQLWLDGSPDDAGARAALATALEGLSRGHPNAPTVNWYLTEARELRGEVVNAPTPPDAPPQDFIDSLPLAAFLTALPTRLHAEETLDVTRSLHLQFTDVGEDWTMTVRRGVCEVRPRAPTSPADLKVVTTATTWRRLLAGKIGRVAPFADGRGVVEEGTVASLAQMLAWFR